MESPKGKRGEYCRSKYALGNLGTNNVYAWTADDYKVAKLVQECFANHSIKRSD